jgi:hypothetical protein
MTAPRVAALEMSSHAIAVAAKPTETADQSPLASLAQLARGIVRPCTPPPRLREGACNPSARGVLDRFEGLREIGDEILDVLDAHRDPDERIGEADLFPQFPRDP